ncbi:MAG: peptide chain release factor 1 [Patescibacteria group bacterium]
MYEDIKKHYKDLENELMDLEFTNNPKKLTQISRDLANLKEIVALITDLEKVNKNIKENEEIVANEKNEELKEMAATELLDLRAKSTELQNNIEIELHPADPSDKKDVIMEIRAGTGGDESALFTADLFRLYSRFAERQGWKINILNSHRIGIGGFKEIIFEVKGKNVYSLLKYECGTHRVQRIPETEKQGRIHTSAVTVAVMPEADEIDMEIKNEDLRIDTYAASGPGGQKVNTTNSAVRIIHLPTNLTVQCQDQNSQHQNKDKAMQILRSRLLAKLEEDRAKKEASQRKQQIGTGDRSEKIRTYNFPQDRVTDHRIKKSWHSITRIMDGEIIEIIEELKTLNTNEH